MIRHHWLGPRQSAIQQNESPMTILHAETEFGSLEDAETYYVRERMDDEVEDFARHAYADMIITRVGIIGGAALIVAMYVGWL